MVWSFRHRLPYTQDEIAEQIFHIGQLISQAKLWPSPLATQAVETSRQILAFMLDAVQSNYESRASDTSNSKVT